MEKGGEKWCQNNTIDMGNASLVGWPMDIGHWSIVDKKGNNEKGVVAGCEVRVPACCVMRAIIFD